MKCSDEGLSLIKSFEGWSPRVYVDPVGLPTIGYGHLITRSELGLMHEAPSKIWIAEAKSRYPDDLTFDQGLALLKKDVEHFERGVTKLVKVDLKQTQFDALVSFSFNVGLTNFLTSTLLRRLNTGDYDVGSEFLKWSKARDRRTHEMKTLAGLMSRRKAEVALYERT